MVHSFQYFHLCTKHTLFRYPLPPPPQRDNVDVHEGYSIPASVV